MVMGGDLCSECREFESQHHIFNVGRLLRLEAVGLVSVKDREEPLVDGDVGQPKGKIIKLNKDQILVS